MIRAEGQHRLELLRKWIIVRDHDIVQVLGVRMEGSPNPVMCMPITASYEDAVRLAKIMTNGRNDVRPSEIGSIPGETFDTIRKSQRGTKCRFCALVTGWLPSGNPEMKFYAAID